jgi:NitT/TauT family transport system substrate-binding protein
MKTKILVAVLAAIIVVFLCFVLIMKHPTDGETSEVSFGYQPFGNNLPIFVALDKGFFKEQGIKVKPVKIISANDAANAVVNGNIVGNATVPLNVLLNIEENQPGLMKIFLVKATSKNNWSDYLLVKKGSNISSLERLASKKVGGYPGSAQQTLIRLMLSKFMTGDQIITMEMPPSTQLPGLDSGQIAALLTYDELAITAIENGIADVLVENPLGKYVVNPLYGFPYVLSTDFLKKNPQAARKIRDAMYKAADFIKTNEQEAREIMSKWVGTKPEIAAKVRLWEQAKVDEIDREALQRLAEIFFEAGITKKKIDTSGLYLTEEDLK